MPKHTVASALFVLLALGPRPACPDEGEVRTSMDPLVARCVLRNLPLAETRASAELLTEACATLVRQGIADAPSDGARYLTKCYVPGDPEWVEFRLLTRAQCASAKGVEKR